MDNEKRLRDAFELALADTKFMGDTSKVDRAIEALTPKSTISATLKRLQGNARRDFLDKRDSGVVGYTEETRADKMRKYVHDRFKSYMEDPKTSDEANRLFNDAFPPVVETLQAA